MIDLKVNFTQREIALCNAVGDSVPFARMRNGTRFHATGAPVFKPFRLTKHLASIEQMALSGDLVVMLAARSQ